MRSPVQDFLDRLTEQLSDLTDGTPYQTIPATAEMDTNLYGVALTTVDGHQYHSGDAEHLFSLQSISKAFTYGLALEDLGPERVLAKIDVEPSGDPFNEISLQSGTGRPDNPMINAGAIATTSLIKGRGGRDRMGRILHMLSLSAGRELKVSEQVFKSEDRTGARNRALAWLLRSFQIIESDPEPVAQDYFRQCSVLVTAQDLSIMAATLANHGVNPITHEKVFSQRTVRWVMAVMGTCGMYDDAGTWAIEVGLPAKSGVGGGLLVVVPGQLGIAVFSPPLDQHGTSVRGAATIRQLTDDLGLHFGDAPSVGRSTIRADYTISDTPSGIPRGTEAAASLERHGGQCRIMEIGGELGFSEAETLVRAATDVAEEIRTLVLDVRKVDDFGRGSVRLLARLVRTFLDTGRDLVIVDDDDALAERLLQTAEDMSIAALPSPLPEGPSDNPADTAISEDPEATADVRSAADALAADESAAPEPVGAGVTAPEQAGTDGTDAVGTTGERGSHAAEGAGMTPPLAPEFRLFLSRAQAIEWVEHRTLERNAPGLLPAGRQAPERSAFLESLGDDDAELLSAFMETRSYRPGQVIRRVGQPFGGIYFITAGQVELTSQGTRGRRYRQAFLSPGMTFGEVALGQTGRQLTTVRALTHVTTRVLTAQVISALEESDPRLAISLWTALARDAYTMVELSVREAGARQD